MRPARLAANVASVIREPADVLLAVQMGLFVWRAPAALRSQHLAVYLRRLRRHRGAARRDLAAAHARIVRIRQAWLWMPFFRNRDSCYVRALALYRFLEAGDLPVRLHFGIEEPRAPGERLHGHAWVSVGDQFFEGPPVFAEGRLREIPLPQHLP